MKKYGKCNCGRKKQRPVSRERAQNGTAPAWKLHVMEQARGSRARRAGTGQGSTAATGRWAPQHHTCSHVHIHEEGNNRLPRLNRKNRPVSSWSQSRRKRTSGQKEEPWNTEKVRWCLFIKGHNWKMQKSHRPWKKILVTHIPTQNQHLGFVKSSINKSSWFLLLAKDKNK